MIEKLGITPGPWDDTYTKERCFIDSKTHPICDMPRAGLSENDGFLIAAAPEMLEQLLHAALAHEAETGVRHASVPTIEKATGRTWKEFKQILEEDV